MKPIRAGVVTVSDKGYAGQREDVSGPLLVEGTASAGRRGGPPENHPTSGNKSKRCSSHGSTRKPSTW